MNRKLAILGALVVVATMVASGSLFTVLQTTQAIVVQLGEAKRVIKEPGLNWKLPLVQNVIYYDKRVLDLDPPSEQVLLADQKRINVDAFARYRITDPLRFFQSVQNEAVLRDRFGKVLNSSVRSALGQNSLLDLLSPKRDDIMSQIKERVAEPAKSFGIEVVDVRIGRSDLPEDISKNVYDRMRSEREREANLLRAEGDEIKQRITAEADRTRTVIVAEAGKTANILIGDGNAERNRILGDAYGRDPEFFAFLRSMEAYKEALGGDMTMVLSPNSDFFRFFGDRSGKRGSEKK
ncbi:MAG: protease modulator HflC [Rhodospirillales bacterium]|nr:protease modulator HflC [Rhodospirillales bacterium]MCW9002920.1 protease modulator HflC [Rhodospirillales bacterium]